MSHFTPRRVALLLGQDLGYCRKVLSGVLGYAEEKQSAWLYHDAPPDLRILPLLKKWQPDGIIAHLSDMRLARSLIKLRVPLVSTTQTLDLNVSLVDVDHEKVGVEAARYFLNLGHRHFGYYGSRSAIFSREREHGFRKTLKAEGHEVSGCHADFLPQLPFAENWSKTERQAALWVKKLKKPAAILASNDIPARVLCRAIRLARIRIPQEIAVLGVDNDSSECRMASPSLSSIDIPAEKVGYHAAEMLDRLMSGRLTKVSRIFLPPFGVVTRQSTDHRSTLDPKIKEALDYINEHACLGINVLQVCTFMGMSRRSAERLFEQKIQSSVYHQIQATRINQAKHLLSQTELNISEIAERSGFGSLRCLNRTFRLHEKQAPSGFRLKRTLPKPS